MKAEDEKLENLWLENANSYDGMEGSGNEFPAMSYSDFKKAAREYHQSKLQALKEKVGEERN